MFVHSYFSVCIRGKTIHDTYFEEERSKAELSRTFGNISTTDKILAKEDGRLIHFQTLCIK